jgi:hypothetical protein
MSGEIRETLSSDFENPDSYYTKVGDVRIILLVLYIHLIVITVQCCTSYRMTWLCSYDKILK